MADEKQRIIEFDETSHINADDHVLIDGATAGTRSLKVSDLPGGGSSGVQDVLVDNVSVVDNEIASIDLSGKQDALTAGSNITIDNNVISAENTTYTAGDNIQISNENEISATNTTYSAGTNVSISAQNEISATDTTYTAGTNVQISNENVISATDTTYSTFSGSDPGLVPSSDNTSQTKFLRGDGSWQDVSGGGSDVSVTQVQSTGAKIATITVDSVDTDLYAPNDSVAQNEVTTGNYEVLLSDASSGPVKKNAGLYYEPNGNRFGFGRTLTVETLPAVDLEPTLFLNNIETIDSYGGKTGTSITITSTDIELFSNVDHKVHARTWDGTNESLYNSIRSIVYSGTTTPTSNIGRDNSVYYKLSSNGEEVIDIYFKIGGSWKKYVPPVPEPPASETLLYNWDFRISDIDTVEGLENIPGAGIQDFSYITDQVYQDSTKGRYIDPMSEMSCPMVQLPVDLRVPGYRIEIEFGTCQMSYSSDYQYPALICSYYDPAEMEEGKWDACSVGLYYNGAVDNPEAYPTHEWGGVAIWSYPNNHSLQLDDVAVNTNEDDRFWEDSKFTLVTVADTPDPAVINPADYSRSAEFYAPLHSYNVKWEIYKDDVLVGTTPSVVTGFYNNAPSGVPGPVEATYSAISYYTSEPSGYFKGLSFGIPCCTGSDAGIEVKTVKIYRINNV